MQDEFAKKKKKMYSSGSEMKRCRLWLLPAPDAAIVIQNKRHEGLVKNRPCVVGQTQLTTNGRILPIWSPMGALLSLKTKS